MRSFAALLVFSVLLAIGTGAGAQETTHTGRLVVGAHMGFGFEWTARSAELRDAMDTHFSIGGMEAFSTSDVENSAGFTGGGGFYVNYYLLPFLALEGGLGFIGKGRHWKGNVVFFGNLMEGHVWTKLAYMEIPVGVTLNLRGFRLTTLLVLNIGLTGKTVTKFDGNTEDQSWGDNEWDVARRVNLGLRLGAGYAIPLGPVVIVPGVDWSTHFLNEYDDDDVDDDIGVRFMTFLFKVAVEYTLPI
jgi:hypothetical protein